MDAAAAPVIAALGQELPGCEVKLDKLNLVIQRALCRHGIAQLSGLFTSPFCPFPPGLVSDLDRPFCHP